jgi:hypothetical protein
LLEGVKVFRFDVDMNMNNEHAATNKAKRGKAQAPLE